MYVGSIIKLPVDLDDVSTMLKNVEHGVAVAKLPNDGANSGCVAVGQNEGLNIIAVPPLLYCLDLGRRPSFVPVLRQPLPPVLINEFAEKIVLGCDRVS